MAWTSRSKTPPLGDDTRRIYEVALGYLARREYSVSELAAKLRQRGAEPAALAEVMERLQATHAVDDSRYAAAYVRDRREFHPCGAALIRRELTARGVDSALIEIALAEEYDRERQQETLRRLIRKTPLPPDAEAARAMRQRLIRRLLAKGFPQGMILDELSGWEDQQEQ